jgi:hypothetical protein
MVHEIGLTVARFQRIPWNPFHGHVFAHGVRLIRSALGQPRPILPNPGQRPLHRGATDPPQLLLQLGGQPQFAKAG